MTVVIVMPAAEQRGGGELMLRHLVEFGKPHDVRWVVVFLEHGPMVEEFRGLGISTLVVEAGRLRDPIRTVSTVAAIFQVARRERCTLVLGWMTKAQIYGGTAAMLGGWPAVWYQLGTAERRDWIARLATALPARGVITLSRDGSDAQGTLRPRRPQRLVYPGVELDRFDANLLRSPAELRGVLGLPASGALIGIVSRLQRWKGVHVVIDAMRVLRESHPDSHCVVVGGIHHLEPEYFEQLRGQVAASRLTPCVTFAGLQPNVPQWMQAMDIVVHASDREPFGMVVIEAMALGKPVVAGSEGGPREIITEGVDGLLVPFGDSAAMARALRRYLDDPAFAAAVGTKARERAAMFSAQRYAGNIVAALREFCGQATDAAA